MKDVNRRSVFSMIAGFFGVGVVAVAKPNRLGDHPQYENSMRIMAAMREEKRLAEEGYDGIPHNKFYAALRYMADTIPQGNSVVLYPCGCSAGGADHRRQDITSFGVAEGWVFALPQYCPTHDVEAKRERECTVVRGTRASFRPSREIEESVEKAVDSINRELRIYNPNIGAPNA